MAEDQEQNQQMQQAQVAESMKKIKGWMKFCKQRKYITAEQLDILEPETNRPTSYFKLIIKDLQNISYSIKEKVQRVELQVKFYATFFGKKCGKFFGRTCESVGKIIRRDPNGTYKLETQFPMTLYYHTRINYNQELRVIIEMQIYELGDHDVLYNTASIGWIDIDAFSYNQSDKEIEYTTTQLKRGSPRDLLNLQYSGQVNMATQLIYVIREFSKLSKIAHLIPESIIVGDSDHIPGIRQSSGGIYLLSGPDNELPNVDVSFSIYIMNVRLRIPEFVETEILMQMQRFLMATTAPNDRDQTNKTRKENIRIIVKDRKLSVAYHNGWRTVNNRGLQNYIGLKEGIPDIQTDGTDNYKLRNFYFSGMHDVDNVFCNEKAMLIIQLDYEFDSQSENGKQTLNRCVGWLPVFISDKLGQNDFIVSDDLLKGPGKTINGQKMIEIGRGVNNAIKVNLKINLSRAAALQLAQQQQEQQQQQQQESDTKKGEEEGEEGQQFQRQYKEPQEDYQQALQREVQIQQLKLDVEKAYRENEELKKIQSHNQKFGISGLVMPSTDIPEYFDEETKKKLQIDLLRPLLVRDLPLGSGNRSELEKIIMTYKEREKLMLQLVQEYREKNQTLKLNTAKEFEELQKIISNEGGGGGRLKGKGPVHYGVAQEVMITKEKEPYAKEQEEIQFVATDQRELWQQYLELVPKEELPYHKYQQLLMFPENGIHQLPRSDKTYLLKYGIKGLMDDIQQNKILEDDELEVEYADTKKVNIIMLQLLALKLSIKTFSEKQQQQEEIDPAFKTNSAFMKQKVQPPYQTEQQTIADQINSKQDNTDDLQLPERLYVTFYFYDLPLYQSEIVSYRIADDDIALRRALQNAEPIPLFREQHLRGKSDQMLAGFTLEVDPSIEPYKNMHKNFIQYLHRKCLHINIWDAESQILFGFARLPLKKILRHGEEKVQTSIELDILEPNFKRVKGNLIMGLKNFGKAQKESYRDIASDAQSEAGVTVNRFELEKQKQEQSQAHLKKKVVSSQPLAIPQNYIKKITEGRYSSMKDELMDQEQRKKERIRRFKMQQLKDTLKEEEELQQQIEEVNLNQTELTDFEKRKEAKLRFVNEVNRYKQDKKDEYVKKILTQFLNEDYQVNAFFGQAEIFAHEFMNKSDKSLSFKITVTDPDERFFEKEDTDKPEIKLVNNPAEWKFWVEQKNLPSPSDYKCISGDIIILDPGERVSLLFKILILRQIDTSLENCKNLDEVLACKDISYRQKYGFKRSVKIYISELNKEVVSSINLTVIPRRQVVDYSFHFYEREESPAKIIMPPLYNFVKPNKQKPVFFSTFKKAVFRLLTESDLLIELKAPKAAEIMIFNLLIYNDVYFFELLANWQIQIIGVEQMDVTTNTGQIVNCKLQMPGDISRIVQMFSTKSSIAWFTSHFSTPFALAPGKMNIIPFKIQSLKTRTHKIQLNCVDINTKEVLYIWTVKLNSLEPEISSTYDIITKVGKEETQGFMFVNKRNEYTVFSFQTSDPNLLIIPDQPKVGIDAKGKLNIKIKIPAQSQQGIYTAYVFTSDSDEQAFECLEFKIRVNYR